MKTLLFASACIVLISGPALACRGTAEFPRLSMQLEQLQESPERISALAEQIGEGQSMHRDGHREGNMAKLLASLRILDALNAEFAPWEHDFHSPDGS